MESPTIGPAINPANAAERGELRLNTFDSRGEQKSKMESKRIRSKNRK
jgi:hypothetical protein